MREEYSQYSKEQLIEKISSLEAENKFLKECIRGTDEFQALSELGAEGEG